MSCFISPKKWQNCLYLSVKFLVSELVKNITRQGHLHIVDILLTAGADVNQQCDQGINLIEPRLVLFLLFTNVPLVTILSLGILKHFSIARFTLC